MTRDGEATGARGGCSPGPDISRRLGRLQLPPDPDRKSKRLWIDRRGGSGPSWSESITLAGLDPARFARFAVGGRWPITRSPRFNFIPASEVRRGSASPEEQVASGQVSSLPARGGQVRKRSFRCKKCSEAQREMTKARIRLSRQNHQPSLRINPVAFESHS